MFVIAIDVMCKTYSGYRGEENRTYKKFLLVRQEGQGEVKRNIDLIIALGYRVQSQIAIRFRRWTTERLKQGGNPL